MIESLARSGVAPKERRPRVEEVLADEGSLIQLLRATTVDVHEAVSFEEALQRTLDHVCMHLGWPVGHVYLAATTEGVSELVPTGIWHMGNESKFAAFRRVTEATRFDAGRGLPGRVLADKHLIWIRDVTRDPNFPRARLAEDVGVRAGFAFPVLVGSDVVAVLEFFSDVEEEASRSLLETISRIAAQLSRVLQRKRAEDLLARERDFTAAVMDLVDSLILVLDARGRVAGMNLAGERALGSTVTEARGRLFWDLAPPEESERIRALFEELSRGTSRAQIGSHWVTLDGRRREIAWSSAVLCDAAAGAANVIVTGVDVTEQRRAEEERTRLQAEIIEVQAAALEEMAAPLIPLSEGVVVMPIMGRLDSRRAQRVLDSLMGGLPGRATRVAILDLTGVTELDAQGAKALTQAAKAARLLGARTILTGIRPDMARSLVACGADLGGVGVQSSLQRGIEQAMGM